MTIQGLTSAEALTRLSQFGLNSLPEGEKRSFLKSVLTIVREPMVILLIAAGTINLFLAEPIDAVLLTFTVFIIIGISIVAGLLAGDTEDIRRRVSLIHLS